MKKMNNLARLCPVILALLAVFNANNLSYALEDIRDIDNDPVSIKNDLNYGNNSEYNVDYLRKFSPYSQSNATLRGGVSQLVSVVGKSQLIRFDEPVKRISITNPALADVVMLSKQEMLLNGKVSGITSLIIWGERGDPVFFDLNVRTDSTSLLEALKDIVPDEEIDIKFVTQPGGENNQAITNAVFSGKISSTIKRDKIKDLVTAYGFKFVDLAESNSPQVVLEVKIVEASRSLTRNLRTEISGGTSVNPSRMEFFINPFKNVSLGTFGDTIQSTSTETLYKPQLTLGFLRLPIINSSTGINLQESTGKIKILAEPKLVTINKQKASFNAGQEIPVPTGIDSETGQINYAYKNVGVNLEFTPEILEESNKILLKLAPEVNEIDSTITVTQTNGIVIYGIRTRKTNTTVELNDGQTLVIAGLIQRNDTVTSDQVPFLADIPVIGNLFSSKEFRKGETELMIFVTPRIIKSDNLVNGV